MKKTVSLFICVLFIVSIILFVGHNKKNTEVQYISLCDFDGTKYVSKKGQSYIDALSKLFPLNNKNDTPFVLEEISFLSVVIFILFCYNNFNYGVVCRFLVF